MTPDDGGLVRVIWLVAIGLAVFLTVVGVAIVARRGLALRSRLKAYAELPVARLAGRTRISTARLPHTIADASQLLPRARRALVDLQAARDSLERSATTVARAAKSIGRSFSKR